MWGRKAAVMLGLLLASLGAAAPAQPVAAPPVPLRLCVDEQPLYPWRLAEAGAAAPASRGLDYLLLELAARRSRQALVFTSMPWKRCQLELQQGLQDAVLGMSFRPDRLELGVFPLREGQPDEGLRMRRESYSLYKRVDQPLAWDGRSLLLPGGEAPLVGAQAGYSIIEQLQAMGLQVDAGTRSVAANLEKLLRGRVQALALLSGEGDAALRRDERWAQRVQRLEPPLAEKSYFLVFSRSYFAAQEAQARRLWSELAPARESPEFRRTQAELLRD